MSRSRFLVGGWMKTDKKNLNLIIRENRADDPASLPASASPEETAAYIADVTLQMRNLANRSGMKFLSYLLEMSFQEAFDISQGAHKEHCRKT